MPVEKNTTGGSGAPADDETPDWTTWLRSRLERVVTSERKGTDAALEPNPPSDTDTDTGASPAPTGAERQTDGPDARPSSSPAVAMPRAGDDTLAGVAHQVGRLAEATTACRTAIEEQRATSERLAAWMQELATVQADDERWATAVGRVVDAVDEGRGEDDDRAGATLEKLASRVERIEEGLGQIANELAGLRQELERPSTATVRLGEPQLRHVATSIAAALSARSDRSPSPDDQDDQEGAPKASGNDAGRRPVRRSPRRSTPLRAVPTTPARRATGRDR